MIRTILALIGAAIILFLLHPIIVAAYDKGEPQLFINYAQFHKKPIQPSIQQSASSRKPSHRQMVIAAYHGRHYSTEEIIELINQYSLQYGIDPATPLCIAQKESGFNQFAKNKSSSASGIFQYISATWKATDQGKLGLSVFDAPANVKAAVSYLAIHRKTKPWTVAKHCPSLTFRPASKAE